MANDDVLSTDPAEGGPGELAADGDGPESRGAGIRAHLCHQRPAAH